MPRVRPLVEDNEVKYEIKKATDQLLADLRHKKIDRKRLLKKSGTSTTALSNQLTRGKVTLEVYLAYQLLKRENN